MGQASEAPYIGRFAPSPSGPLHAGSLIAALASYLDARANHGKWLLRIEDLDPPRESPEASQQIIDALECLHLDWDGEILYQSQRIKAYQDAIDDLYDQQLIFPCTCSRQDIRENEGVYPGTCRHLDLQALESCNEDYAIRCRVDNRVIEFTDIIQGPQSQNLQQEVGDFIIKRKDGLFAYQLAVVLDDAYQNVSHVIRGIDLLDSTPRQIYLQQILNLPRPVYGHIPIIINEQGQKLSKQHHALPLMLENPSNLLITALQYLQQKPPQALVKEPPDSVLAWAIAHWEPSALKNLVQIQE